MIFGYGKVGKGIAKALACAGTPKENIVVVETSVEAFLDISEDGYGAILNDLTHKDSIQQIKQHLPKIWAVITATGVENSISNDFSQSDFEPVPLLINMGTADEFGRHFSAQRILNEKRPANFLLDYPIEMIYLDPIFSLFLQAGEQLLNGQQLVAGLNGVSTTLDKAVLAEWVGKHGQEIWQNKQGLAETENALRQLQTQSLSRPAELIKQLAQFGIFDQATAIAPLICLQQEQQNTEAQHLSTF